MTSGRRLASTQRQRAELTSLPQPAEAKARPRTSSLPHPEPLQYLSSGVLTHKEVPKKTPLNSVPPPPPPQKPSLAIGWKRWPTASQIWQREATLSDLKLSVSLGVPRGTQCPAGCRLVCKWSSRGFLDSSCPRQLRKRSGSNAGSRARI